MCKIKRRHIRFKPKNNYSVSIFSTDWDENNRSGLTTGFIYDISIGEMSVAVFSDYFKEGDNVSVKIKYYDMIENATIVRKTKNLIAIKFETNIYNNNIILGFISNNLKNLNYV